MDLQVTAKNIELTPELREYIEKKLNKINRHLPNIIEVKVEIASENARSREQRYIAQITINSGGILLRGEERGNDLFTAIDKVASIMNRQVERYKGKRYVRKGGVSPRTVAGEQAMELSESKIVKVKQFAIKLMPPDEAIEQMELLGHDFFLFLNNSSGKINLLYRRKDKNYGIIEPTLD